MADSGYLRPNFIHGYSTAGYLEYKYETIIIILFVKEILVKFRAHGDVGEEKACSILFGSPPISHRVVIFHVWLRGRIFWDRVYSSIGRIVRTKWVSPV